MKPLKEGQRVRVKGIDIKGRIFFIDQPNYWNEHMRPIQVELDKPHEHGQTMYRTDVQDIVRLKPKKKQEPAKKKKKAVKKNEGLTFDFSE